MVPDVLAFELNLFSFYIIEMAVRFIDSRKSLPMFRYTPSRNFFLCQIVANLLKSE
jgi:hypothetical protein